MMNFNFKNPFSLLTFYIIAFAVILGHSLTPPGKASVISLVLYLLVFLLGIWLLRKSLLFLFTDTVTSLTLVMITAGTNIFYLTAFDMQFQAILCFSLYAALLFLTIAWHDRGSLQLLLLMSCVIALLIIIHPTGYISLFIPVLWGIYSKGSWIEKRSFIRRKKEDLLFFLAIFFAFAILPVIAEKIKPGEISFLDIRLPGVFCFGSRYLWDDLLSVDHGLLIYTPVIILPLIGFYFLAEKRPFAFYAVFIFCLVDLFMETCWTDLSETAVFGQIGFVPMMAVLSFPLASFMEKIITMKWWWKILLLLLSAIIVTLSLFQSLQYRNRINAQTTMITEYNKMVNNYDWTILELLLN